MTKDKLDKVTEYLKDHVWRNSNVMFDKECIEEGDVEQLVDIISSLHNLLYEEVTGERYNYAFHWANKVGSDTEDNIFDAIMKYDRDKDESFKSRSVQEKAEAIMEEVKKTATSIDFFSNMDSDLFTRNSEIPFENFSLRSRESGYGISNAIIEGMVCIVNKVKVMYNGMKYKDKDDHIGAHEFELTIYPPDDINPVLIQSFEEQIRRYAYSGGDNPRYLFSIRIEDYPTENNIIVFDNVGIISALGTSPSKKEINLTLHASPNAITKISKG